MIFSEIRINQAQACKLIMHCVMVLVLTVRTYQIYNVILTSSCYNAMKP